MRKHQNFHKQKRNWFQAMLIMFLLISGPMYLITKVEKTTGKVYKILEITNGQIEIGFIGFMLVAMVGATVFILIKGPNLFDLTIMVLVFYFIYFAQKYDFFDRFEYDAPCSGVIQMQRNNECQQLPIEIRTP